MTLSGRRRRDGDIAGQEIPARLPGAEEHGQVPERSSHLLLAAYLSATGRTHADLGAPARADHLVRRTFGPRAAGTATPYCAPCSPTCRRSASLVSSPYTVPF